LHRRGNERTWWQTKGIDPLPLAAALWASTHDAGSTDAKVPSDFDEHSALNGRSRLNGARSTITSQHYETKPIRPEAK
jgi:hypothetical protein